MQDKKFSKETKRKNKLIYNNFVYGFMPSGIKI